MRSLSVGLLSRERSRGKNGRTMWRAVLEVLKRHEDLDLLVCAGFTTSRHEQIEEIVEHSRLSRTLIACELSRSGKKGDTPAKKKRKKSSCLYWIYKGKKYLVAGQKFSSSADTLAEAKRAIAAWQDRLDKQPGSLPPILWINCGEIFVFENQKGKQRPALRFKKLKADVKKLLGESAIVINPMHDRMPRPRHNDGIGRKLTRLVSTPKAYVRVSNWNTTTRRKQKRNITLLHKAYIDGECEDPSEQQRFMTTEYLFSEVDLPLAESLR